MSVKILIELKKEHSDIIRTLKATYLKDLSSEEIIGYCLADTKKRLIQNKEIDINKDIFCRVLDTIIELSDFSKMQIRDMIKSIRKEDKFKEFFRKELIKNGIYIHKNEYKGIVLLPGNSFLNSFSIRKKYLKDFENSLFYKKQSVVVPTGKKYPNPSSVRGLLFDTDFEIDSRI
jgi:hypothetical protein